MRGENLTRSQRWEIADKLAADRLPAIDSKLEDVRPSQTLYARFGKRALDIIISAIALIITLPINIVLSIATYLDVGRPLFFRQERTGRDGKPFAIIKFRNMTNERDEQGELLPPDKRVTRFGRFMRRTSLDELLNFWSIFKGDMSIIGPRPLVPEYARRYNKRHRARLSVKPGLECPPHEGIEGVWTWGDQLDNDVWYVENVSLKTDVKLLMNLLKLVLDSDSNRTRGAATRGIFMGYDPDGRAITMKEIPLEYIEEIHRHAS